VKRWIVRAAVLGVVVASVVLIIRRPWRSAAATVTFSTVAVSKGPISAQITANGTLSPRSTTQVGAQVSGRVIELHADFNDRVKKGQLLAKLDEQVLLAQLDQVQAAYELARANRLKAEVTFADAKRQLARQQALQQQQLVSGATLEAAEVTRDSAAAALEASRAQVQQATATLKQARTNLAYAAIYSPVDGIVLSRAVELGQTVAASLQAPVLFTIAEDLTHMQIDSAVAEADIGRLREGMTATFTVDAFAGKTFEGVIRQVRNAPTTTSGVVTYDAVVDVDNAQLELRPGMTASVTFVLDHVTDAVRIPSSALRFKVSPDQLMAMLGDRAPALGPGGPGGSGEAMKLAMGAPRGGGNMPPPPPDAPPMMGGELGPPKAAPTDRKVVWKLVGDQPQPIAIKVGLGDGSLTQLVEGDLQPGDQLITEVSGLPSSGMPRKIGVF
jgi:HlyD family secretion protein